MPVQGSEEMWHCKLNTKAGVGAVLTGLVIEEESVKVQHSDFSQNASYSTKAVRH